MAFPRSLRLSVVLVSGLCCFFSSFQVCSEAGYPDFEASYFKGEPVLVFVYAGFPCHRSSSVVSWYPEKYAAYFFSRSHCFSGWRCFLFCVAGGGGINNLLYFWVCASLCLNQGAECW
tara:strand:- start:196 stop:549 length:354 start_codon:yes stop_codon:yes gene_type:complete